jgi:hypothetical protein
MKKLMILGGIIGFSTGMVLGTLNGTMPATSFWRATIAAVVCGYLLRWWGKVWIRALHDAHLERNTISTGLTSNN